MPSIGTPGHADSGQTMVTDIHEHPAVLLTAVDREAHDWMMRFADGNASQTDLAAFKEWSVRDPAHAEAFTRACRLWEAIGPASKVMAGARHARRSVHVGRRAFIGGAIAASAAGAGYIAVRPPLGLWPSLAELAADYRTAPGEQRSIALTEGPSVELNTRTSIALRASADGANRIELLGGEAEIATRPEMNQTVEVIAADGHVTAADAVFNIRYEYGIVRTTCVGGALDVMHGDRSIRLHRGEQVVYSPDGLGPVKSADLAAVTAWKNGVLVFQLTPLADAIAEINRYRPGRIVVTNEALGRRLFSARFQIANIGGVVAQIQQVFGASVTSLPGGIVLLG